MARTLPTHVKKAIRSGPVPKLRDWRCLPMDKLTRAERNMAFCEKYCVVPEAKLVGKNIQLADFQEAFFYSLFDSPVPISDAYLSIARKNSKTATIAMIVLLYLVGPEAEQNSEIMSGAMSREQASQVFRYASKMVKLSPRLGELVRITPSGKRLLGISMGAEYHASSAEASTTIGGSPRVAILDELGQIRGPQSDYVDAITSSQGAHDDPLLIGISTQAPNDGDLWSIWLDGAETAKEPNIVSHVYETPMTDDITSKRAWKKSNPALGLFRSEADLRRQAKRAKNMPSSENGFRNLCLNQRVSSLSPFVSRAVWQACGGGVLPLDGATGVWGGLDLSMVQDLTALVLVWQVNGIWQVQPHFWAPEKGVTERSKRDRVPYDVWAREGLLNLTPGATVDYDWIAKQLPEILGGCDIEAIAFDRYRIKFMQKELDSNGIDLPLVEFGQGYKSMGPALEVLEAELLNERLVHGDHPVMNMCAMNAVATTDPTGRKQKLAKNKGTGRIDGMQALAMALGIAQLAETEEKDEGSVYDTRGIIEIDL